MVSTTSREHLIACLARWLIGLPARERNAVRDRWLRPADRAAYKGDAFVAEVRAAIQRELAASAPSRADAKMSPAAMRERVRAEGQSMQSLAGERR